MSLPLTKTLDPPDFTDLAEELRIVDQHFLCDSEQHVMRRWEYALALRAYDTWCQTEGGRIAGPVYDVGGSGSPFYRMLDPWQVRVIDPHESDGRDLAAYLRDGARLGAAVFCLSVLEHVEDLAQFLYHLNCLVAPGGLLFLTMDICGCEVETPNDTHTEDRHHFRWQRKRIFSPTTHRALTHPLGDYQFRALGGVDTPGMAPIRWHGAHVWDYSLASLALVKRA